MEKEKKTAVVDNDFIIHLVETERLDIDISAAISMLFNELHVQPTMHELVYTNELNCHGAQLNTSQQKALSLISNGDITITWMHEIQKLPGATAYYTILFQEIYNKFSSDPLPSIDILTGWVSQKSLGEVHSVVLCFFLECGIFLSDDRKATSLKAYLNESTGFTVEIYNRHQACERAKEIGSGNFPRKVRKALSHE